MTYFEGSKITSLKGHFSNFFKPKPKKTETLQHKNAFFLQQAQISFANPKLHEHGNLKKFVKITGP
jgi:hypothetical protein